jgi:uncharacterized alkaline shock family protein YloU
MRTRQRFIIGGLAVLSFVGSLFLFLILLKRPALVASLQIFFAREKISVLQVLLIALLLILILADIAALIYAIFGERINKNRIKSTEIGQIDIGPTAIANIALNSAKASQAGIKSAKAKVYAGHNDQILIYLNVILYSDVEIPLQMAKIQERVKKDVEKYTGIGVEEVRVKVSRVELIGTKIDR